MMQLSMFDLLEPPPAPVDPLRYVPPATRDVMTRAYGRDHSMKVREDEPDPFEIEVRGIPCLIHINYGFSTYAVTPAGSPFWSESGYRSWTHGVYRFDGRGIVFEGDTDDIILLIETYIDTPAKKDGLGGKLVRWWPGYVTQWRGDVSWSIRHDRATMWDQWGPEKQAEVWAAHDKRIAENEALMWATGIDPNDVGPPQHHKGHWPHFKRPEAQA